MPEHDTEGVFRLDVMLHLCTPVAHYRNRRKYERSPGCIFGTATEFSIGDNEGNKSECSFPSPCHQRGYHLKLEMDS